MFAFTVEVMHAVFSHVPITQLQNIDILSTSKAYRIPRIVCSVFYIIHDTSA